MYNENGDIYGTITSERVLICSSQNYLVNVNKFENLGMFYQCFLR
jgi:hypothetical protein